MVIPLDLLARRGLFDIIAKARPLDAEGARQQREILARHAAVEGARREADELAFDAFLDKHFPRPGEGITASATPRPTDKQLLAATGAVDGATSTSAWLTSKSPSIPQDPLGW